MTSLEFIEKEIEYCISLIEKIGSECETDSLDEDLYFRYLEQLEQKLNQLRQIKTELEAWEEIKKYLVLDTSCYYEDCYYEYLTLKNEYIDESNSEEEGISLTIIKKALEEKE